VVITSHFYYGDFGPELYLDWCFIVNYPLLQQYTGISI
jgi:hypothetical protein